jgi:hypothetical protein
MELDAAHVAQLRRSEMEQLQAKLEKVRGRAHGHTLDRHMAARICRAYGRHPAMPATHGAG